MLGSRRDFSGLQIMNDVTNNVTQGVAVHAQELHAEEHWTTKDGNVKLFMFEKSAGDPTSAAGRILFVHGSSMAAQPTFDLHVDGRPDSSVMDWFARRGFDCWCVDMEGYGRSTKDRDNNAPIAQGADNCLAAATYIQRLRGKQPLLSSTAFRPGRYGRPCSRNAIRILSPGSRSMPWCGLAPAPRR
jgi:hypothetical protein